MEFKPQFVIPEKRILVTDVKSLAYNIKQKMKDKKITAYEVVHRRGVNKMTLYSVLQMGENPRDNYNIEALFQVLKALRIKLEDVC